MIRLKPCHDWRFWSYGLKFKLEQLSALLASADIESFSDRLVKIASEPNMKGGLMPVSALSGGADVDVLRLDRIHSVLSGNKLFKLYGHITEAVNSDCVGVVSPGGVHSNHLHALAAAGQWLNLPTTGLIRGYENVPLTATLRDCQRWGMSLQFLDRKTYDRRYDLAWQCQWRDKLNAHWIGEGGAGDGAVSGMASLARYCAGYDEIWLAVGSGTTAQVLAGMLPPSCRLVGVNVLADQGERQCIWQRELPEHKLIETSHYGRFAHLDETARQLIRVMDDHGLPLDPVYGVRLMRAFLDVGPSHPECRCLLIHGGGLQGRRGYGLGWPMVGHDEPAFDLGPTPDT